jgi:hypothetical protein
MFSANPHKYVLVTDANPWTDVLTDIIEHFGSPEGGWGMSARVVDKAAAAEFLSRGVMHIMCNDPDVATNLRFRHREGYFVPAAEFPQLFSLHDRVLIVKKRSLGEDVPTGHDSRYHFFLVTAEDPATMAKHFDGNGEAQTNIEVRGSRRKCGTSAVKAANRGSNGKGRNDRYGGKESVLCSDGRSESRGSGGEKRRSEKGLKRNVHRWRF